MTNVTLSWLEQNVAYSWESGDACVVNATFAGNATLVGAAEPASTMWVGILLSVLADTFIAVSLAVQKLAHNRNANPLTGKPMKPFIKLPLWWCGISMNGGGEIGNMLAYAFAPAAIVAPVGSVGVVVNEIIAVCFLKEPLRKRDLLGLLGVIAGVVLIILGVPESKGEIDVHTLLSSQSLLAPRSCWYLLFLIATVIILMWHFEPRYAQKHILVWLTMCSIISSMTVIACRGFASMVTHVFSDCASEHCLHGVLHPPCSQTIFHWLFWILLLIIVITAVWSAFYLNKAMQVFGNTETVPVYYCTFTLMSIIGGAVVFNEFERVTAPEAAMFGCGIVLALAGVWLITSNRKKAEEFQNIGELDAKLHQLEETSIVHPIAFGGAGASAVQAKFNHDISVDEEHARQKMLDAHMPGTLRYEGSRQASARSAPPSPPLAEGTDASPTTVVELSCAGAMGSSKSSLPGWHRSDSLGSQGAAPSVRPPPLQPVGLTPAAAPDDAPGTGGDSVLASAAPSPRDTPLASPVPPDASGSPRPSEDSGGSDPFSSSPSPRTSSRGAETDPLSPSFSLPSPDIASPASGGGSGGGAMSGALARARQARRRSSASRIVSSTPIEGVADSPLAPPEGEGEEGAP